MVVVVVVVVVVALALRAVVAHGGTVQVQSNEKEGTIFTLIFPMDSRIKKDNKKMDISSEPKLLH